MSLCSVALAILFLCLQSHKGSCDIQSFAVAPRDTQVVAGRDKILHCQVLNQVGAVQWSKNGVLLGFDPDILGYPRYRMISNSSVGIFDLQIKDAKLEDDADFECQVGPAEDQPPLFAKAHLTVLLPPTSIKIVDVSDISDGNEKQIKMSESLSIVCEVSGGKPAPKVLWYRNALKLSEDSVETEISDGEDGRQLVKSTLRLNPSPDDNKAYYSCETLTPFPSPRLKAGIYLDVLYPPGFPTIEGYRTNEKIRAGDSVNLRCVSRGGNPLARLVWTKDGEYIDHSYSTSDWEAMNEISFVASASDDGAVYKCSASSVMTSEPMEKSVTLSVLYSPSSATIKAPKEAKPGDVITATCKTERSNPAAEITWVVDGQPMDSENIIEPDAKGGWITTSKIKINVTEQDRNSKLFTCYAVNQELGETIPQAFSVSILYAPDPPSIFGYTVGTPIPAGKLQRLTCISHGGNPLPNLKWYKGDKEISGSDQSVSGNIVSKELSIIAAAADNQAQYHCKSSSKALAEPLISTIILTVYFPPSSLTIKVRPKKPKAGSEVRLICESDGSNPAANITWWKEVETDVPLTPILHSITASSENGGFSSKSVYAMNVTASDDASKYTCQATNEAIQRSILDSIILNIFYKPVFEISDSKVFEVKENESIVIDVTAKANPDKVTYRWMKDNDTVWEGPILNITAAERSQTGTYSCEAKNDVGESLITIVLKVLYPAIIIKKKDEPENIIIAEPGTIVKLECRGDGYPLPSDALKWKRDNFDMNGRTETLTPSPGKSILVVKSVTRDASGEFTCIADNGVGNPDTFKILLLVKHEPIIKDPEIYKSVLSDRGKSAQLYCKAEGIPDVSFSWSFEGAIVSQGNDRMTNEVRKLDYLTWQGNLTIADVNTKDFGEYKCIARNEIGFATAEVNLLPDSAPDPPIIIKVINTTKDSILVTWVPGFSGGHNQTQRIRFKSLLEPAASYIDVHPPATNSVWIQGLKPSTEYEVAIMSLNVKGSSPYTTDVVKAKTLDLKEETSRRVPDENEDLSFGANLIELLAGTVGTVFLVLLVFNIVLLALYYHKKSPRRKRKYVSEESFSSISSGSSISQVESEETTLSSFPSETIKTSIEESSTYSRTSSYSKSKSESYYSAEDMESSASISGSTGSYTSSYSGDYSGNKYRNHKYAPKVFV